MSFDKIIQESIKRLTFTNEVDLINLAKTVKGTPVEQAIRNATYIADREKAGYQLYEIFAVEVQWRNLKGAKLLYNVDERDIYYNQHRLVPDLVLLDDSDKILCFVEITRSKSRYKKMFLHTQNKVVLDSWGRPIDYLVLYVNKSDDFDFDYQFYPEVSTFRAQKIASQILGLSPKS